MGCVYELTRTRSLQITIAVASLFALSAQHDLTTALIHTWKCDNKLATTISNEQGIRRVACLLCMQHYSYEVYKGNDALLKRRWNLNIYLKYIQSEVTVSLSCAGFYNSPFSISHVRKMFLPHWTAQSTLFMYYSITLMQINHWNVYLAVCFS